MTRLVLSGRLLLSLFVGCATGESAARGEGAERAEAADRVYHRLIERADSDGTDLLLHMGAMMGINKIVLLGRYESSAGLTTYVDFRSTEYTDVFQENLDSHFTIHQFQKTLSGKRERPSLATAPRNVSGLPGSSFPRECSQ